MFWLCESLSLIAWRQTQDTDNQDVLRPTKSNPHPFVSHLIKSTASSWKRYVRHPFVDQLGKGTLKQECFKHYIIQDWIYLKHCEFHHSADGRTPEIDDSGGQRRCESTLSWWIQSYRIRGNQRTRRDCSPYSKRVPDARRVCKSFAVGYDDLQSAKESPHTSAYARYILDIGMQGDLTELLVAVASCLIGYGEVGLWLLRHSQAGWDGIHLEGKRL